ncbi:MAG: hypothetical protein EBQ64_05415 [Acidimicrobiia bacterium]|nr:hypothetical protein [Acidimicrobiia bacterium]
MNSLNKRLEIVDISPLTSKSNSDYEDAASRLYSALSEIGFAIITNHGVDDEIIADMRRAVAKVFETPREILMQDMVVKGNYRGFVPLGYFTPNSGKGKADQYEAWKLHTETDPSDPICQESALYGPNKWPRISFDIKTPVMRYWQALANVSERLIVALCSQLQC